MSTSYYAAACQTDFAAPTQRSEIRSRVDHMLSMARNCIVGYRPFFPVKLLVFPEFAHAVPIHEDVESIHANLAVSLPNEHTERYESFCREHDVYIQTGSFLEKDPQHPGLVFNTTLLVGPNGILLKYRKVNPWIPWEVHSSPHDVGATPDEMFPVADTPIGKIGVAICYDWLFPEVLRQLSMRGAEVLIRVSAYMDPWGATEPMDWWTLFNRARAAENTAYVVAANQGASMHNYPPFSWPGGSMVVDYDGRILAQADAGPGEKVVVAPVDVGSLRKARTERMGHDMRAHMRPGAYDYFADSPLAAAKQAPSVSDLNQRIQSAKNKL